ncbi:MAG: UTRA domain-containing protein [Actinobacteria bacterium]|uniref:Unannotated protein n=1 Tax=freshwater metagenome TaxID=449393 RepID=A0A6J7LED9_9ZZZZ|nr:UTRA domain-containing protein [Actinomycetota bacterium]
MSEPRVLRYQQVKDLVLTLIADRGLVPGDRLPSASELVTTSGVSQISVRRALDELEQEGRITRHQGVGTFVAQPRIVSDPARTGDLLATLGEGERTVTVDTELLGLNVGIPGAAVARTLRLRPGQPVWEVIRRRLTEGRPVILERAVLPLHLVPALDEELLAAGGSLYGYLRDAYGLVDSVEEQCLEVTMPSADQRARLSLPARELVVTVRGVSFHDDGTPFDCFTQVYPARQFAFYVSGSHGRRLLAATEGDDWSVRPLAGQ